MSEAADLVVRAVEEPAPLIRELRLARPDGGTLPAYVPGSHVVVDCGGTRNAYSLTGSGAAAGEYRISVLLRPDGRGGSAWLHRREPGDVVRVSAPRSAFPPVATARRHLLVAGGIGITPLLSHVRAALAWERDFTLLYGHRPGAAAHLAEARESCGDRLHALAGRAELLAGLDRALRGQPLGTHLYACGPAGMIEAVRELAGRHGWPDGRIHVEHFDGADLAPGEPFTVRLARTGRTVPVPSGTALLEALEQAGVPVPNLCRRGVCGECRIPVLAGRPEHRDLYLTAAERAAADTMMACVSRGAGLELDM